MKHAALLAPLGAFFLTGAQIPSQVEISLENVRNGNGQLHLCLTRNPAHFPDCGKDPSAVKQSIAASSRSVRMSMAPGAYAVSVLHDENRNGELETFLGIPREGFGFSRNPRVRFRAPGFEQVRMNFPAGFTRLSIRMQYLL